MYTKYFKRILDIIFSFGALIAFSPIFLLLIILGVVEMKGNPFFVQKRPGLNEKVISLIKFRTMTNEKDKKGRLLPDDRRLNKYGRILRSTSLDELPELLNILKGDLSFVGPRPLLVNYLPYYTEQERHRHDVRPGLTGLAQVNGRSFITWEEIFAFDIDYVNNLSFAMDIKIIIQTIRKVLMRKDIADASSVEKNSDGQWYVEVKGEKLRLHQPLDIERGGVNVK